MSDLQAIHLETTAKGTVSETSRQMPLLACLHSRPLPTQSSPVSPALQQVSAGQQEADMGSSHGMEVTLMSVWVLQMHTAMNKQQDKRTLQAIDTHCCAASALKYDHANDTFVEVVHRAVAHELCRRNSCRHQAERFVQARHSFGHA